MIKGLLIYNSADADRNKWFINEIIKEGAFAGLDIQFYCSSDIFEIENGAVSIKDKNILKSNDFAIMRDRDGRMSEFFEKNSVKVFNSSKLSFLSNDKWETYCYFKDKVPMMYSQRTKLPYPFVMKTRTGHGGSEVFLIEDADTYEAALKDIREKGVLEENFIYQMVATDKGKDLRVYVIGDYVMASMLRESLNDFRANISLGAKASYKELSEAEMRIVSKVKEEFEPGFFGIDIIYNRETPVLNEIEDVVGSRMLYEYTDINVAREYIKWVKEQLTTI